MRFLKTLLFLSWNIEKFHEKFNIGINPRKSGGRGRRSSIRGRQSQGDPIKNKIQTKETGLK
jgi:hypothetical protein